ncbi:hypothetical protein SUGI_0891890 [Cryptomeria japonica]|nr:hypothetical protein SUGI_0891890 [Cryptomeria japonica]
MAPSACAASRSQRKKGSDECLLAPHFPSDDLQKFAIVQKVYGFSHIVKMLKVTSLYPISKFAFFRIKSDSNNIRNRRDP